MSGATSASFVYDGDGTLVKSVMGGVTTYYVVNYFEWTGDNSVAGLPRWIEARRAGGLASTGIHLESGLPVIRVSSNGPVI